MNHNNILLQTLQKQDFLETEQLALKFIKQGQHDLETFLIFASSLGAQHYYQDAKLVLQYCRLVSPENEWILNKINEYNSLINNSLPVKYDFNSILNLPRKKIAIATIVKNEEDFIERWILNAQKIADEILIVDTGSTDTTMTIINKYPLVKLITYEWQNDFAAARNAAFPFFTADWVFWMDADEFLSEEDLQIDSLHFVASFYEASKTHSIVTVDILNILENDKTEYSTNIPRFFSLTQNYCFTGAIHEQIIKKGQGIYENYEGNKSGILLLHDGYHPTVIQKKDKINRNILLLREEIKKKNSDPSPWFYLGRELFTIGDLIEAKKILKIAEIKTLSEPNFQLKLDLFLLLAKMHYLENEVEDLFNVSQRILEINPSNPLAIYYTLHAKTQLSINEIRHSFNHLIALSEGLTTSHQPLDSINKEALCMDIELLKAQILCNFGHLAEAKTIYTSVYKQTNNKTILQSIDFIKNQHLLLNQN